MTATVTVTAQVASGTTFDVAWTVPDQDRSDVTLARTPLEVR